MVMGKFSCFAGCFAAAMMLSACDRQGRTSDAPETHPDQKGAFATEIKGAPEGAVDKDSVQLKFSLGGDQQLPPGVKLEGFQCKFGASGEYKPCSGDPFVLSGLRNGDTYELIVQAILREETTGAQVLAAEAHLAFKVDIKANTPATETGKAIASTLQVGSAYQLAVPAGMHVTEYSTSKTTGVLSILRILPESDPYYLGNFSCTKDWDRMVASVSPAGEPLMYCHSTPTRAAYKDEHENRLANNHVEISTDKALVTKEGQERLSVSIYDSDYEFKALRSRFYNSCQNSKVDFITVPMLNNFFIGKNPEQVDFWYCDTYQPDMTGTPQLWRIGAFLDTDHIDWQCADCRYDRAVEAVYMVRANAEIFTPEAFAKSAQRRILDVLTKVTP